MRCEGARSAWEGDIKFSRTRCSTLVRVKSGAQPGYRGRVRLGIMFGRFLVHYSSMECNPFSPEVDVGWEVWLCPGDVLAVGWGSYSGCVARERER
jgi:hypothetical protein